MMSYKCICAYKTLFYMKHQSSKAEKSTKYPLGLCKQIFRLSQAARA